MLLGHFFEGAAATVPRLHLFVEFVSPAISRDVEIVLHDTSRIQMPQVVLRAPIGSHVDIQTSVAIEVPPDRVAGIDPLTQSRLVGNSGKRDRKSTRLNSS